jgi:hypothetical protein
MAITEQQAVDSRRSFRLLQSAQVARAAALFKVGWFFPLLALHLCLTLPLAWELNTWIDEASSLETTRHGVGHAASRAVTYELQAPLYFASLAAWRMLDGSIFHARLFSVIAAALALWAVAGAARRYLPMIHPGWVVALVAFNPFTVWAATEIRVYALTLLLGALLLRLFYDGYVSDSPSPWARRGYALVALVALYTYYYLGFLLLAHGAALVALRRWRAARDFLLWMAAVGAGFTPLLAMIPGQMTGHTGEAGRQSLSAGLRLLSWRVQEQLLPVGWPSLEAGRRGALCGLGLLALALAWRRGRQLAARANVVIWASAAVAASCLLAAYVFTSASFLEARHTTVLFLPLTLGVCALVAQAGRRSVFAGWVIVALCFSAASLAATYKRPAKTGDWKRVAAYLMSAEERGQPILVFQPISAAPLAHYYAGVNRVVPVPQPEQFQTFNSTDSLLTGEAQLHRLLAETPGGGEVVWLVTDDMCRSVNLDLNCGVLESFVGRHYDVVASRAFFRSKVRLLRRKPQ